jgi:hypothetical protein
MRLAAGLQDHTRQFIADDREIIKPGVGVGDATLPLFFE